MTGRLLRTAVLLAGVVGVIGPALTASRSGAVEVQVRSVDPQGAVPRYAKCELGLDVKGARDNPYDPEQIDVSAHFRSPGGREITVPAFFCQPHRQRIVSPQDRRRQVQLLKFYVSESDWPQGADLEFFLDDVKLVSRATGGELLIDDGEGDRAGRVSQPGQVEVSAEVAHSGGHSIRFRPTIEGPEDWPGALWQFSGADWSAYDGLTMEVYPRTKGATGPVHLYFRDAQSASSPIAQWQVGSNNLRPNQWNRLEWDWRGFGPDLTFVEEGAPGWRVRFTPTEVGTYRYTMQARDKTGEARTDERTLQVRPSADPGFVRVSKRDPHYFEFDNGRPFFTIGHDVPAEVQDALEFFPKMQAAGENCTYVIMYPDRLAIEWKKLGRYDQRAAAALDWYLTWAEQHGIYLKLSFDEHCVNRPSAMWNANPYNAANGGPCPGVNDFYTSAEARKLYRQRLRYVVARWGYSPHVMAWEYFAENDGATALGDREGWGYPTQQGGEAVSAMLVQWLREMSACVRGQDPYAHLITESFGSGVSDPNVWAMPEIEYTQIHQYSVPDVAGALSEWCLRLTREYAKPMQVTEFGWMVENTGPSVDPDGACLHHGIWATMASGSAGTAMTWWCQRVDDLNLYYHFRALANFAQDIDWTGEGFRPLQAVVRIPKPDHYTEVTLPARGPFSGATVTRFTVARDGTVNDPGQVPQTLLARGRAEPRTVPEFQVNYPEAGKFTLHVDSVSPDALLEVQVDGQLALRKALPAENVEGKPCVFDERWKVWRCQYDEDFGVDVPAGKHTVRLENAHEGFSWIRIDSYRLTAYAPPTLRALGLAGRSLSFLWLQNQESAWWNAGPGQRPRAITGASVEVPVAADGAYSLEWWDTYKGIVVRKEKVAAKGKTLVVPLPPLERDVAVKVRKAA